MGILKLYEQGKTLPDAVCSVQPEPLQEHGIPFPGSVALDAEIVEELVAEAQAPSEIENPGADLDFLRRRLPDRSTRQALASLRCGYRSIHTDVRM